MVRGHFAQGLCYMRCTAAFVAFQSLLCCRSTRHALVSKTKWPSAPKSALALHFHSTAGDTEKAQYHYLQLDGVCENNPNDKATESSRGDCCRRESKQVQCRCSSAVLMYAKCIHQVHLIHVVEGVTHLEAERALWQSYGHPVLYERWLLLHVLNVLA